MSGKATHGFAYEAFEEEAGQVMKLFDSGPAEGFQEDVALMLSLTDDQLGSISKWVERTPNLYPYTSREIQEICPGVNTSDLSRILSLVRYVVGTWKSRALTLDDLRSDLSEMDFSPEDVQRLISFLSGLDGSKEKVHQAILRNVYENIGLATIDDVNITWDLRPVFEELVYPGESFTERYQNLISSVYVLVLELSASRADGKQESQSFQLSEEEFERFLASFQRAKKQLEIFKKRAMAPGGGA